MEYLMWKTATAQHLLKAYNVAAPFMMPLQSSFFCARPV